MAKPENPLAYPSVETHPAYDMPMHHFGMSLRDYFAGQVIAAAMMDHLPEIAVRLAYEYADAMLAERAKEPRS